jgi:hypothetical protein
MFISTNKPVFRPNYLEVNTGDLALYSEEPTFKTGTPIKRVDAGDLRPYL